jgi:hypothetical protein
MAFRPARDIPLSDERNFKMKRRPCISLLVASVLCVCSVALAQQENQPQTNCGAAKTIKAGSTDTSIVQVTRIAGLPCEKGYFYKSGTEWIELNHSSISRAKLKDTHKEILSGGIVSPGMDVVYEGPQALVKVTGPRPTFYVRMPGQSSFIDQHFFGSRTKLVIVQLDQKKSTRTLEVRPTGIFNWRGGARLKKQAMNETVVIRVSSDVVAITPKSDLRPGEYLLTEFGPGKHEPKGDHGYDFTVLP